MRGTSTSSSSTRSYRAAAGSSGEYTATGAGLRARSRCARAALSPGAGGRPQNAGRRSGTRRACGRPSIRSQSTQTPAGQHSALHCPTTCPRPSRHEPSHGAMNCAHSATCATGSTRQPRAPPCSTRTPRSAPPWARAPRTCWRPAALDEREVRSAGRGLRGQLGTARMPERVIDDRPFPLVQFNPLGEPQRDQALAQHVLHRLPKPRSTPSESAETSSARRTSTRSGSPSTRQTLPGRRSAKRPFTGRAPHLGDDTLRGHRCQSQ
jgi:hypothetical protein